MTFMTQAGYIHEIEGNGNDNTKDEADNAFILTHHKLLY